MQGVTRSPYPSFTIDESFQAFLNIFSSYIEPTHGLLFAVECTNIGFLLIRFGYHNERYSLRSDFHKRSEEHTSELQSRQYLVCRLLLEKKTDFRGPDRKSTRMHSS